MHLRSPDHSPDVPDETVSHCHDQSEIDKIQEVRPFEAIATGIPKKEVRFNAASLFKISLPLNSSIGQLIKPHIKISLVIGLQIS